MKRTFHPDLSETLTSYEIRMTLSVTAARVVRWRSRSEKYRRLPWPMRLITGGVVTQWVIDAVADVAESDYLEEVMAWDNPLTGEM